MKTLNFEEPEIVEALVRIKAGKLDYFDREVSRPFTSLMEDWLTFSHRPVWRPWKFVENYLSRAVVADAETNAVLLDTHTLDPQVSLACKLLTDLHNASTCEAWNQMESAPPAVDLLLLIHRPWLQGPSAYYQLVGHADVGRQHGEVKKGWLPLPKVPA